MTYGPEGNPETAKIVLVGEAPAKNEILEGRPFVGLAGYVLNECLESAGILRSECYLTNIFDFMVSKGTGPKKAFIYDPEGNLLWSPRSGLTFDGLKHNERLWDELAQTTANVIVPLGGPAIEGVCAKRGVMKWRGSVLHVEHPVSRARLSRKAVPSIHPANALHGQYSNRYIIRYDLARARHESHFPDIRRPKYIVPMHLTHRQCLGYISELKQYPILAVDIEVERRQCSYIGYAWSSSEAVSIPYGAGGWTVEEEAILWHETAKLLENPNITKIFHNGPFDVQFLFQVHNILVQGPIEDTMLGHHIVYPDFPKSLAFLASLYTDQPYWKDMVKMDDIHKEDG